MTKTKGTFFIRDPKDNLVLRNLSCKVERRKLSCSAKIIRHCSVFEVREISVLTLSIDEGQDDTGPAILKRSRKINVLTLSIDEGQDDTGPTILKR
ncbi:hypothetical protein GQ457_12G016220 [Hibiscus cannabinus]